VIAKRRTERGSGLGKLGWVVAVRTHASTVFVVFAFALSVAPTSTKHILNSVSPRLLEHLRTYGAVFLKRFLEE
jgi:hypothetical protein